MAIHPIYRVRFATANDLEKHMPNRKQPAIIRNYALFSNLLVAPPRQFVKQISDLKKEYGLPVKERLINVYSDSVTKNHKEVTHLKRVAYKKRLKFLSGLQNKSERLKFAHAVKEIRTKYKLGREWSVIIANLVISDIFFPPTFNLSWKIDKENNETILTLNPTTALIDIEDAWPYISKEKERVFGKSRGNYHTKKAPELYLLMAKDLLESSKKTELDLVSQNKYKLTDKDRVGTLFKNVDDTSEIADLRRLNLVRTLRKRFKKKFNMTNSPG